MPRAPRQITYVAQVARIRIETAVVEFKADAIDENDAKRKAVRQAERLPAAAWNAAPTEPGAYRPHVQAIASLDELDEDRQTSPGATNAELIDASEETRYLLLKANCGTAEGDVILQPWLVVDQPDLLASDLCRDWIGSLQSLGITHMSERLDDLAAGDALKPSDRIMFRLKRPRK